MAFPDFFLFIFNQRLGIRAFGRRANDKIMVHIKYLLIDQLLYIFNQQMSIRSVGRRASKFVVHVKFYYFTAFYKLKAINHRGINMQII